MRKLSSRKIGKLNRALSKKLTKKVFIKIQLVPLRHSRKKICEVGEELFLSGNDAIKLPDMASVLRKIDEPCEALGSADEENGVLRVDIGDEKRRKKVVVRSPIFFEFLNEGGSVLFDLREADLFDLGHAEEVATIFVFFAVCRDDVFA